MKEKETLNYTYQKGSLHKETRKSSTAYNVWIKENMPKKYTSLHNKTAFILHLYFTIKRL